VIQLSGYMADEKRAIAQQYLIPSALKNAGVKADQVVLTDEAVDLLNRAYCRESGVRNLQKHVEKVSQRVCLVGLGLPAWLRYLDAGGWLGQVYRKAALQLVKEEAKVAQGPPTRDLSVRANPNAAAQHIVVTPENLNEFVGQPVFLSERLYETTPPGVVTGLAWTAMGRRKCRMAPTLFSPAQRAHACTGAGGSTLYIETVASKADREAASSGRSEENREKGGKGRFSTTGASIAACWRVHGTDG
jgi:Lon-like ATP-dependent protease